MARILVIEDEEKLRTALVRGLTEEGFEASAAADGEAGLATALGREFDAIILDLMLPGREGLDVLEVLRARHYAGSILILSARGATDDRVRGLDIGADDYLSKPFAWSELMARLRACLRRAGGASSAVWLRFGGLELDRLSRRVSGGEEAVELTQRECDVLSVLMRNAGQVVSREMLAREAWHDEDVVLTNVIDVFINQIRKKLGRIGRSGAIETVRGVGYSVAADESKST